MQRDEAAGRVAEDDRALDAERAAQRRDVVGHLLQGAGFDGRAAGPALSPQIDVDDLRVVAQRAQPWPPVAMVEARPDVQYHACRAQMESLVLHAQLGAVHIDLQLGVVTSICI